MNFTEAIVAIKSGFKLRRPSWAYSHETYIKSDLWYSVPMMYSYKRSCYDQGTCAYGFSLVDVDATDWEIVSE